MFSKPIVLLFVFVVSYGTAFPFFGHGTEAPTPPVDTFHGTPLPTDEFRHRFRRESFTEAPTPPSNADSFDGSPLPTD
ncbi:unnamed protein product [Caenorhabditis brenneri]